MARKSSSKTRREAELTSESENLLPEPPDLNQNAAHGGAGNVGVGGLAARDVR